MPYNATSFAGRVSRSFRQSNATALTIVYEEDGARAKIHYASVPISSDYQVVLQDARQCFADHLPSDSESYKLQLKHELRKGCWAIIHPQAYPGLVGDERVREFKIEVCRTQSGGVETDDPTKPPPYSSIPRRASTSAGEVPSAQVLDIAEIPIADPEHEGFYCDRCDHMLHGVRYSCTTCEDFDYCAVCIGFAGLEHTRGHRFDAIINTHTRIYRPGDERYMAEARTSESSGFSNEHEADCDICGADPITGTRYKCVECPDWDACQDCLERSWEVHPEHTFVRIDHPGAIIWRGSVPEPSDPPSPIQPRQHCGKCFQLIRGPTYFRCNVSLCPFDFICTDCEALPSAQEPNLCKHPLIKYRV